MLSNPFFPENGAVYEVMWKNMVDPDKSQVTIHWSACALHDEYLRLQTHTQNICNNYFFSIATMVFTNTHDYYVIRTLLVWLWCVQITLFSQSTFRAVYCWTEVIFEQSIYCSRR
jgi:hypothetical protein